MEYVAEGAEFYHEYSHSTIKVRSTKDEGRISIIYYPLSVIYYLAYLVLFGSARAETNSALMVCMRFSASSKTFEKGASNTSSVTS